MNQSSIFGHISAKFAQNWTNLNLKNLAKCLAKWQSSIWRNLAKYRPSFGYFENFDLATLSSLGCMPVVNWTPHGDAEDATTWLAFCKLQSTAVAVHRGRNPSSEPGEGDNISPPTLIRRYAESIHPIPASTSDPGARLQWRGEQVDCCHEPHKSDAAAGAEVRIIMATKAQSWITPRPRSGLRLSCSNYAQRQRLQQIGSPKSPLKPLQGLLRSQGDIPWYTRDYVLTVPVTQTTTR